jgi:histidinol-phosphate aminotransferase
MLTPSYAMYPIYARMFGAEPIEIGFDADLMPDTAALLDAVGPGVRAIFIANPNQPTGTRLSEDVLEELLARAGDHGTLTVIDEAYFPFSGATVLPWLSDHPHLVVLRTFSKAWGLAGLRAGVICAAPEVARTLYKVRTAYDVNTAAAAVARTLLARPEVATAYAAEVRAGREALQARARALGLEPLPGLTNFQLIRVAGRIAPADLVAALHERRYIVKGPFSTPGLEDCIRVTLGPPELMERFADALEEVLGGAG